MKSILKLYFKKSIILVFAIFINFQGFSQSQNTNNQQNDFWQRVQFGGGLGLAFGVFTNVSIAPQAIYNVNEFFSIGTGVHYNYLKNRNISKTTMVGGSLIGLFNPIESIQLSVEIEQLHVDQTLLLSTPDTKISFWNTAAFIGGGYRVGNITIGGRYNLLFNKDQNIYGSAFMPFVRAFF